MNYDEQFLQEYEENPILTPKHIETSNNEEKMNNIQEISELFPLVQTKEEVIKKEKKSKTNVIKRDKYSLRKITLDIGKHKSQSLKHNHSYLAHKKNKFSNHKIKKSDRKKSKFNLKIKQNHDEVDTEVFDCDKVLKELYVAGRKREPEIKKSIHKVKIQGKKKNKHKISPNPEKQKTFGISDMMVCPIVNQKSIIDPAKPKNISTPDYKNIKEYNARSLKQSSKTFRNLNNQFEEVSEKKESSEENSEDEFYYQMHKPYEQKEIDQFEGDEQNHQIDLQIKQKLIKDQSQIKNKRIDKIQEALHNKKQLSVKQKWHYEKNDYVFYGLGKKAHPKKRIKENLIVKIPLNF